MWNANSMSRFLDRVVRHYSVDIPFRSALEKARAKVMAHIDGSHDRPASISIQHSEEIIEYYRENIRNIFVLEE